MSELNITDPTSLYTLARHKKEINQVKKGRKNIVQEMKGINQRIF